jgi:hypothetical protein
VFFLDRPSLFIASQYASNKRSPGCSAASCPPPTAFRKDPQSKKSAPLADAVMIALSAYPTETVQQKAEGIRTAIQGLLANNDDFRKAFGTGTNGKGAIRKRIELAQEPVRGAVEQ